MGLNMTDASYARSASGQKVVTENLIKDINNAYKVLSKDDTNYKALLMVVKKYWSGADANTFLKLLDDQRESIQNRIKKYQQIVTQVMIDDRSAFEKGQSNISSRISSDIKIDKV